MLPDRSVRTVLNTEGSLKGGRDRFVDEFERMSPVKPDLVDENFKSEKREGYVYPPTRPPKVLISNITALAFAAVALSNTRGTNGANPRSMTPSMDATKTMGF
jgi:hypothetical protein